VAENYISRRLLSHLGRIGEVTPYPKGLAANTAIMNTALVQVTVNETVVLDIVAGDTSVTRKIFRNVRFIVFGDLNHNFTTEGVGEVVLGSRVLRELGGLSVFEGFSGAVQQGVRVVEVVTEGRVLRGADTSSGKAGQHDEL
jgi:hypothetical protein